MKSIFNCLGKIELKKSNLNFYSVYAVLTFQYILVS